MLKTVTFRFHPFLTSIPQRPIRIPGIYGLASIPPPQCPQSVCRNSSSSTKPANPDATRPNSAALSPARPPPTSAYVHLPFCRRRCHYCDFPIVALGSPPSPRHANYDHDPRIRDYVGLVLREIAATGVEWGQDHPPLETVFFGGGTPSLVPPRLLSAIIDALRSNLGLCAVPEISIEMDPGTFDAQRLQELLSLGVSRVSLGVQAFQEELLRACGRAHGLREVHEAIEIVVGSGGLDNWSMDLISSLPHQTVEMWQDSLSLAVDAQPTHISVYDLQVEQGTKFGHLYTPGEFPLPSESQSAEFYRMASETLRGASYDHYEISSYCKSGFECKHNLTYWQNRSFYGFGLASASYIDGRRFSRPKRMKDYANYVQELEEGSAGGESPASVAAMDMATDVVMLSLRTARGLDMKSFSKDFGDDLAGLVYGAFGQYMESGHVVALDELRRVLPPSSSSRLQPSSSDCRVPSTVAFIRLSDPDGFLFSNELISAAFGVICP